MNWLRMMMRRHCVVYVGSNRVVVDLIKLGFVVKLPIVRGILLAQSLYVLLKKSSFIPFWRWVCYPMDSCGLCGIKRLAFKGFADNWREFAFSRFERHPFAQTTYFSLFGLVNVQKRGDPLGMDYWDFRRQVERLIGQKLFYSDPHHFASMQNFCLHDGRLRMVDYGSPKTRKVIRERGMHVYLNFKIEL